MSSNNTASISGIPCEICDQLIPLDQYSTHLTSCITNRLFHIDFVIDDRDRELHHEGEDHEGLLSDHDDDHDDNNMPPSIFTTTNNQLVSGRNIQEFLTSHFDGFLSQYEARTNLGIIFLPSQSNTLRMQEVDLNDYEFNLELARRLGSVNVGLKDIDAVSKYVPKPIDERIEDDICPICRDAMGGEEGLARELICGHIFCDICITKWLKNSKKCPMCICDLEEKIEKKIETI